MALLKRASLHKTMEPQVWSGGHVILHVTPNSFASKTDLTQPEPTPAPQVNSAVNTQDSTRNSPQSKGLNSECSSYTDVQSNITEMDSDVPSSEETSVNSIIFKVPKTSNMADPVIFLPSEDDLERLSTASQQLGRDDCTDSGQESALISEGEEDELSHYSCSIEDSPPSETPSPSQDAASLTPSQSCILRIDPDFILSSDLILHKSHSAVIEMISLPSPKSSLMDASTDSGIYIEDKKSPSEKKDFQPSIIFSPLPKKEDSDKEASNTSLALVFVQIFIPYLLAGLGTCATGLLLDHVQHWSVYKDIPQIFILVPPLLGLKGNLEMTLAARLSTQANLGNLDTGRQRWHASWGNSALILCQALVVGFLAAAFAIIMGLIQSSARVDQFLVLTAGCMVTAILASLLLGIVTILVVIYSPKLGIDPDNVATPIAASLGDLTTLAILSTSAQGLHSLSSHTSKVGICSAILLICVLLIPALFVVSYKNKFSRQVLKTGWLAVIASVIITSGGGAVLERSVGMYEGLAIFQPVINGLGGNLVAIHASRLSTSLHQTTPAGRFEAGSTAGYLISPFKVFFRNDQNSNIAKMLLLMVLPGHITFAYVLHYIRHEATILDNPAFLPLYVGAALVQVAILIYLGTLMVRGMWRLKIDPDNSAIPLLTALGDLLGSLLLALAFFLFYQCYPLLSPTEATILTTLS